MELNEKTTLNELKEKAKDLHTKIKNMYEVPEEDRTNGFYPDLSCLWSSFREISGLIVKQLIDTNQL